MDFTPLLTAPAPIPAHGLVAIFAFGLGLLQFALPKGTALHRGMGWAWVVALGFVAASGFFISDLKTFGYLSPIHILSAITLVGLGSGVRAARAGRIGAHRGTMTSLFLWALIVAGVFTFWPGRIMHAVVFGN